VSGKTQKEEGWFLRGYFANSGLVVEKQNTSEREIAAIDLVTAVS
jgi:hypothetical protein